MKWWPEQCDKGDMIRVRIGGIWHFGVYVSDGEVIQFGYPPREKRPMDDEIRVVSTTIDEFAGGCIVEKAKLSLKEKLKRIPPEPPPSRAAVLARAITIFCTTTASILRSNACSAFTEASRRRTQESNGTTIKASISNMPIMKL